MSNSFAARKVGFVWNSCTFSGGITVSEMFAHDDTSMTAESLTRVIGDVLLESRPVLDRLLIKKRENIEIS